ncbi:hypothetical protein QBC46DRAFT_380447 [Diplogelasinospora grovesii]|uniref:Secreted protein n=1 Tax=Diplogelasinospora grovesii TaxID=303347 RepID=A0AAN6S5W1_9PEZI|nr:hypothetical protein QBC46DRAFT_380447 [Diplogelasinospora grovesii]
MLLVASFLLNLLVGNGGVCLVVISSCSQRNKRVSRDRVTFIPPLPRASTLEQHSINRTSGTTDTAAWPPHCIVVARRILALF